MPVDIDYLREHYALLSDEALLEIDSTDLVDAAKNIYRAELTQRNLGDDSATATVHASVVQSESVAPDWIEDAAEVYAQYVRAGTTVATEAEDARHALEAAGVPCHMDLYEEEEKEAADSGPSHRWRVLVPGKLNQHAASVIERDIFNPDFEAQWRSHLELLSDEEVQAMHPHAAFCGLFDRVDRVMRAYREELAHRGMKFEER